MELSTELGLIEEIKKWTQSQFIGDDCAILSFTGPVLASTDSLVENVHFKLSTTSFFDLGYKSAAVNLSDIAAMSGKPRQVLISLILPPHITQAHLQDFYAGLAQCCSRYDTVIAGGNLTSSEQFSINITVLGEAHQNGIAQRNTAQDGDLIVASGDFGASACGFHLLNSKDDALKARAQTDFPYCITRHNKPEPRLELSWQMIEHSKRLAMMDTSDGLADALMQMSKASNVSFEVDLDSIEIHEQTRNAAKLLGLNPFELAFYGGEDYELLACMSACDWSEIKNSFKESCNQLKVIGRVKKNPPGSVKLIQTAQSQWVDCLNMDRIFNHFEKIKKGDKQ